MKKTILATVLLSGLVLAAAAPTALAVEKNGNSEETSRVEVNLKEDKGHEPGTGPFKDKLAIAQKPTVFKFAGDTTTGSLKLQNKHEKKDQQYIAVNDDRKKADDENVKISSPWTLTGQLSALTAGATNLEGTMVFTPTALQEYNIGALGNQPNGSYDYKPADVDAAAPAVVGDKYKLADTFTLGAGKDAVEFLSSTNALVSDPSGVFTNLGNVELNIATGNADKAGEYKGIITWTLAAQ